MSREDSDGFILASKTHQLPLADATRHPLADAFDAEAHRNKATKRILELEAEIVSLKISYNTASTPCRLPTEILTQIFITLKDASTPNDWIQITFVCHHWREVALDCTSLWTSLPMLSSEFSELALCRSKGMPLQVALPGPCRSYKRGYTDLVNRILSQTNRDRIQSLTLWTAACNEILSTFEGSAPLLEELVGKSGYEVSVCPSAPSLKVLHLESCRIPWSDLPLASTLTSIHLSNKGSGAGATDFTRPSTSDLSTSLQEMRRLQNLYLKGYLPHFQDAILSTGGVAVMPALQSLTLHDFADEIAGFFHAFQISAGTISIGVSTRSNGYLGYLKNSWETIGHKSIVETGVRSMEIIELPGFPRCARMGFKFTVPHPNQTPPEMVFKLYVTPPPTPGSTLHEIVSMVASHLDLNRTRALHLTTESPPDYLVDFPLLPELDTINLTRYKQALDGMVDIMERDDFGAQIESSNSECDTYPSKLSFPALKEIGLCDGIVRECLWDGATLTHLLEVLGRRPALNAIRRLNLCGWDSSSLKLNLPNVTLGTSMSSF
ncbi:hypothetical protein DFP72DRAFT_594296 [Ephemerocybe angulata]|uniref:F-box domain-containing protein n=1 Tax=Ephemerocybe angulata TaxID=980116 RepID=A0A8H6MBA2_9AGAR|nr:hypothetical protein DFP72DRAFT_594296 [Tulosesus angulatus]